MYANIAGLVLNLIGAIVLLISLRSQNRVFAKVTTYLFPASSHDKSVTNPKDPTELEKEVKASDRLSYIGLVLFIIGFSLQIICLGFNCFE